MEEIEQIKAFVPCESNPDFTELVVKYADELVVAGPKIGSHGMTEENFLSSGLFDAAIERLRGIRAASMKAKREFIATIMNDLVQKQYVKEWKSTGSTDRFDYTATLGDETFIAFEAKGCLDGNNTNIFSRNPKVAEFYVWSLCQNPGADPRKNVRSGIHTRLGPETIVTKTVVDGLIVWDQVCGTVARPCPKQGSASLQTVGHYKLTAPCLYAFPATFADPVSNPLPEMRDVQDLKFLKVLSLAYGESGSGSHSVAFEARPKQGTSSTERRTILRVLGEVGATDWTIIKR